MSLINEALKKAQTQRPGGTAPPLAGPASGGPPHGQPPAGKRPRSFIWGFLAALFVVGFVTIGLSSFFIWQILETDGEAPTGSPPATVELASAIVEEPVPQPVQDPAQPAASPLTPDTAAPPEADSATPAANLTEEPPPPVDAPAQSTAPEPVEAIAEAPPPASPPPAGLSAPPDPRVIARLMELKIRGIMGGGTKVLIHDTASGQTRAFEAGDSLEGPMGLTVSVIRSSSITFTDYAGIPHTKSF